MAMEILETTKHIDEKTQTVYKGVRVNIGKTKWSVTQASGKFNYITVRKTYPNPFGMIGKEFESFNKAQEEYKSPEVKTMLLMVESNFKTMSL